LNGERVRIDTISPYTLGIDRLPSNSDVPLTVTVYDRVGWNATVSMHFKFIGLFV